MCFIITRLPSTITKQKSYCIFITQRPIKEKLTLRLVSKISVQFLKLGNLLKIERYMLIFYEHRLCNIVYYYILYFVALTDISIFQYFYQRSGRRTSLIMAYTVVKYEGHQISLYIFYGKWGTKSCRKSVFSIRSRLSSVFSSPSTNYQPFPAVQESSVKF